MPGEAPQRQQRKAVNAVASMLASTELQGSAVVVPSDRQWRPKGFGRFDWMSGGARTRIALEKLEKTVCASSVLYAIEVAEGHTQRLNAESKDDAALCETKAEQAHGTGAGAEVEPMELRRRCNE